MPLRDHFRPPVDDKHSWDALHAMWPAVIVQQLYPIVPKGIVAAPGVAPGTSFDIDVSWNRGEDMAVTFDQLKLSTDKEPVDFAGRALDALAASW